MITTLQWVGDAERLSNRRFRAEFAPALGGPLLTRFGQPAALARGVDDGEIDA